MTDLFKLFINIQAMTATSTVHQTIVVAC